MCVNLYRSELQEVVSGAVRRVLSADRIEFNNDTTLHELGADSLDFVCIAAAIEEALAERGISYSWDKAGLSLSSMDSVNTITEALAPDLSF